jgi:mannose-6-phosphate isomerase
LTLLRITNEPMAYAWGSLELLADLLGIEPSSEPMAEVWFGTHPASLTMVQDDASGSLLERVGELGYLVKFLAAAQPLSIQAHPTKSRARAQFAANHKSYSDANHKPELLIAVTEFRALCGFRPLAEIEADLRLLAKESTPLAGLWGAFESAGIEAAMRWIYDAEESTVLQLVAHCTVLGRKRARLIEDLFHLHQADPGILVSVLMNLVALQPGEAIFLPAGNIHAYIEGLGVEVMAASDNVLRGGLTQKRIDSRELMQVLDFTSLAEPRVKPKKLAQGLYKYPVSVSDFSVYSLEPSATNLLIDLELIGSAIVVCVQGQLVISTSKDEALTLSRGQAAYLGDARLFSVAGAGTGYLAMG